jgi:hypothetical protein
MPEIGMSVSMSGDGKRGVGHRPQATAPILDSTEAEVIETIAYFRFLGFSGNIGRRRVLTSWPMPLAPAKAVTAGREARRARARAASPVYTHGRCDHYPGYAHDPHKSNYRLGGCNRRPLDLGC